MQILGFWVSLALHSNQPGPWCGWGGGWGALSRDLCLAKQVRKPEGQTHCGLWHGRDSVLHTLLIQGQSQESPLLGTEIDDCHTVCMSATPPTQQQGVNWNLLLIMSHCV